MEKTLKYRVDKLYNGTGRGSVIFNYGLIGFDLVIVGFFIVSSMMQELVPWVIAVDFSIAMVMIVEYAARFWIDKNRKRFLVLPLNIADVVVILSLLAPAFLESFAFLRVVRILRLLRSYRVVRDLRRQSKFFAVHQEMINAIINLMVFIFFVTALVFVEEHRINPQINTYLDALYFTVTTLTTTGFGDIVLVGASGRLVAVMIMMVGVGLFLRLLQAAFRPKKVAYTCEVCGLKRHDPDAVHCKHCGTVIHIETEGEW